MYTKKEKNNQESLPSHPAGRPQWAHTFVDSPDNKEMTIFKTLTPNCEQAIYYTHTYLTPTQA